MCQIIILNNIIISGSAPAGVGCYFNYLVLCSI